MSLTNDQLQAVAHLARIAVEPDWAEALRSDINGILEQADRLDDPRLNDLEPMAHPLDQVQRLRPDEVTETDDRETLMAAAPAQENGLFLVPKVIE
ncbi:Asp-tRNA(Asn)/Glu-tRNA(Gln) amidotransferase subunit GatC [Guyparkeria hydrothermalis]|uniref:Asp-tRNA(Asn)/Glu-tRNA(Gln) amidotransferase subunit GatC n=1 Tax=Guyparkeria TaxID=2035712 RepID=UPI0010AD4BB5|nr:MULTISPECIES: Asp-tRNA(Asn)/Glu-tRNA(Gln) amidotransferase subunit GatC [Guyparkeria]MCL7750056.1 Asp-tRNA(Asn)/Glu-tRNA(Gln) amidotransferase subunit GatC [Guyparkeria hydrothermalis]TKA89789.1 Asp-tRNA(Asn)/Glu-tRNA(Gln) amidotransferase subunit GatC [Guyparkeria sp. SB14A]